MAFFKFRLPGQSSAPRGGRDAAPAQLESVEVMRRRARHRLIGAAVLVLAAVIGFPLLFDTQPRPVAVDVPISIPDRNKTRPPVMPSAAPVASGPVAQQVAPAASLDAKEEVVAATAVPATDPKVEPKAGKAPASEMPEPARVQASAPSRVESRPDPAKTEAPAKPVVRADDGSRARALLEGKDTPDAAADGDRFIVQVGAFSDAAKAREARIKVERAGLKTYTQVVETKDGKRIRVRVGPYPSKTEADKAAGKIRQLDLPAAILSL
jgi:DedD protein